MKKNWKDQILAKQQNRTLVISDIIVDVDGHFGFHHWKSGEQYGNAIT